MAERGHSAQRALGGLASRRAEGEIPAVIHAKRCVLSSMKGLKKFGGSLCKERIKLPLPARD